jgi:hypothetical protein
MTIEDPSGVTTLYQTYACLWVVETYCIIGIWVQDHLLREAWPDPLGMSSEVTARVF